MESRKLGGEKVLGVPFNIDALLHEISATRTSTSRPTSMGSSSYRARIGKVTKPGSAGSSPQNMQRRRTSASHRLAKYLSDLYPYSAYGQQAGFVPLPEQQVSEPAYSPFANRPVSWHPSTMHQHDMEHSFLENASTAVQSNPSINIYGMPTSMGHPDMDSELPNDDWCSLGPSEFSSPTVSGYAYQLAPTASFQPGPGFTAMHPAFISPIGLPVEDLQSDFSPSSRSSGIWPSFHAAAAASSMGPAVTSMPAFTTPPTPDMLPIQHPADPQVLDMDALVSAEDMQVDDGPELVGMGLYDTPMRPDFNCMDKLGGLLGMGMGLGSEPTGKGLKLEETWEPPSDDDEDDGASNASEDAPNDEDDFITQPAQQPENSLPRRPSAPIETTRYVMAEDGTPFESLQRMYGDMSKQSFFIESGEVNGGARGSMVLSDEDSQLWLRAMTTGSGLLV